MIGWRKCQVKVRKVELRVKLWSGYFLKLYFNEFLWTFFLFFYKLAGVTSPISLPNFVPRNIRQRILLHYINNNDIVFYFKDCLVTHEKQKQVRIVRQSPSKVRLVFYEKCIFKFLLLIFGIKSSNIFAKYLLRTNQN